jgi:hypothetical protein
MFLVREVLANYVNGRNGRFEAFEQLLEIMYPQENFGWPPPRFAQAIEARRAATTGAVHESAVPQECAQSEPSS